MKNFESKKAPKAEVKKIMHSTIKKVTLFAKKERIFLLALILTVAVGTFFRLYNYSNRIDITGDNGRDAQIALYARNNLKIPQIGPFSQAPFFFGPFWYWFLEITYFLPFGIFSPWYFLTILSFLYLLELFEIGRELEDKWLGLIITFFGAISPFAIDNFLSIWNPSVIPVLSAGAILVFLKFARKKSPRYVFYLSLLIGLATTIHFQAFLLFPLSMIAVFISKEKVKSIFASILGALIPFLPYLIFDLRFHWFWSRSVLIYFLIDQPSKAFPYRWTTYISNFLPTLAQYVFGSNHLMSVLILTIIASGTLFFIKNLKKYKNYFLLVITLFLDLIFIRFYKGPKEIYYFIFLYTFLIVALSWVLYCISKIAKPFLALSALIFLIIAAGSVNADKFNDRNQSIKRVVAIKNEIYKKTQNQNINILSCGLNGDYLSYPIGLLIYYDGKIAKNGTQIAICDASVDFNPQVNKGKNWLSRNASDIYTSKIEWWEKDPPQKDRNFWNFMAKKLSPSCYPHCP